MIEPAHKKRQHSGHKARPQRRLKEREGPHATLSNSDRDATGTWSGDGVAGESKKVNTERAVHLPLKITSISCQNSSEKIEEGTETTMNA